MKYNLGDKVQILKTERYDELINIEYKYNEVMELIYSIIEEYTDCIVKYNGYNKIQAILDNANLIRIFELLENIKKESE